MEKKISSIIKKVILNEGLKKYFFNTSWLLTERILKIIAGILVGIWVARYLGPEQYGKLNYVLAFVGLFAPIRKLGLDGIVSRDIVKDSDNNNINQLLSTSYFMKLIGSLIIFIIVSLYMLFLKKDIYFYMAIILLTKEVFLSFEVIEFYYRAKVKAKFISISRIISLAFVSILKIGFILMEFSLIWFAVASTLQIILFIILLVFFFKSEKNYISKSYFSSKKAVSLLKESWPLFFSSAFALIYLNIDKVMIENILNSSMLGQYSVAVQLSSGWFFIPMVFGQSLQTAVINAKKKNLDLYFNRLQLFFSFMAIMSYMIIVPVSFFSNNIVTILYGSEYNIASNVLTVHIFSLIFVFSGIPRGNWVTNESYFKFDLISNLVAGIINIILNIIWIPSYGIIGAAWATLISYFFTYIGSSVFFKPARKIFYMQIKSILLIDLIKRLKNKDFGGIFN